MTIETNPAKYLAQQTRILRNAHKHSMEVVNAAKHYCDKNIDYRKALEEIRRLEAIVASFRMAAPTTDIQTPFGTFTKTNHPLLDNPEEV